MSANGVATDSHCWGGSLRAEVIWEGFHSGGGNQGFPGGGFHLPRGGLSLEKLPSEKREEDKTSSMPQLFIPLCLDWARRGPRAQHS